MATTGWPWDIPPTTRWSFFSCACSGGPAPKGSKACGPGLRKAWYGRFWGWGKSLLLAWLHQEQLPYREDQSNLSRRYLRNQVRLDLLPQLQRDYNPRLKAALWRLMTHLQEDERLLAAITDEALNAVGRWLIRDWLALSIPRLLALAPALQTRLVRRALGHFLSHQEITSTQVEHLLALAQAKKSGGTMTYGTCQVARAGQELHFFPPLPPPPGHQGTLLSGLGTVESPTGWRLEARSFSEPRPDRHTLSPAQAWLDYAQLSFPLSLRSVLPGDRFWPAGPREPRRCRTSWWMPRFPGGCGPICLWWLTPAV